VLAAVLLSLAVMSAGTGLVMIAFVLLLFGLRGRLTSVLAVVAPAVVLFATWFVVYGRDAQRFQFERWLVPQIPEFVWRGLTGSLEHAVGVPGSGALVLGVLVATAVFAKTVPVELRQLALAGIVAAAVQLALNALASLGLGGPDAANTSRYQYLAVVMMTPAVCVALEAARRAVAGRASSQARGWAVAIVCLVLLGSTLTSVYREHQQVEERRGFAGVFKTWAFGTVAASDTGAEVLTPHPSIPFLSQIDVSLITYPELRESLPDETASDQQILDAESEFFVGVRSEESYGLFSPVEGDLQGFSEPTLSPGCHEYAATSFAPEITLHVDEGGTEIGVTSEASFLTTKLSRGDRQGVSRDWLVDPGSIYVATSVGDADLWMRFNAGGDYIICVDDAGSAG
jgi:hypothetical protein